MESRDLNFCAYLIAKGEKLQESISDEYGRFWFIFNDSQKISELSNDYYFKDALVNAQALIIAQKKLKGIVRNFNQYKINDKNSHRSN
jgi:hypothetical protein